MIMAGQHSLGTGAACLIATNPWLIAKVENEWKIPIHDRSLSFWALVHAWEDEADQHVDPKDVTIMGAGVYGQQ